MTRLLLLTAMVAATPATPPRAIEFAGTLSMPARLPDGRIVSLHVEPRPFANMGEEGAELRVYRRLSSDNGAVWTADEHVYSYPAGKGLVSQQIYPLVDRRGRLHAFGVRYFRLPNRNRSTGYSELQHTVSKDGGKTWGPIRRVAFGHDYTGAINSIIQLKSGRILGALSYTSDHYVEKVNQWEFRTVSFYSDDDGETWKVGQDEMKVPFGPQVVHPGAIEPVLLEMEPNQVRMLIRTQTLRFFEAQSSDGGAHFSEPVASRFMAPDSPGNWVRLRNGWVMLVWNDIASYPRGVAGHFRQYLYAAVSRDNGKTWTKPKFVGPQVEPDREGSRGDYPYLCETADGSVLLYYARFGLRQGSSYERQHNELVRLDPAWLVE